MKIIIHFICDLNIQINIHLSDFFKMGEKNVLLKSKRITIMYCTKHEMVPLVFVVSKTIFKTVPVLKISKV
jgi:hypothetical protein